jgi:hypothetical protein
MNTTTTRGVLLLALGSPHYGRMAATLAASLRASDADVTIHLVYAGQALSHLTDTHLALFSSVAACPPAYYHRGDKQTYFKAKTCIYELSPFEETLFLDVDMIWFRVRAVGALIDQLAAAGDFAFQHRGYVDLAGTLADETSFWCNVNEVKQAYQLTVGRYYNLHSEFVFFKKTPVNAAFFNTVQQVYDAPRCAMKLFAGDMADEAAFSIAMAITSYYPDSESYLPVYWHGLEQRMSTPDMIAQYYAMSMGGSTAPTWVIERYRALAQGAAYALGIPRLFGYLPKRQWEPTRVSI